VKRILRGFKKGFEIWVDTKPGQAYGEIRTNPASIFLDIFQE